MQLFLATIALFAVQAGAEGGMPEPALTHLEILDDAGLLHADRSEIEADLASQLNLRMARQVVQVQHSVAPLNPLLEPLAPGAPHSRSKRSTCNCLCTGNGEGGDRRRPPPIGTFIGVMGRKRRQVVLPLLQ